VVCGVWCAVAIVLILVFIAIIVVLLSRWRRRKRRRTRQQRRTCTDSVDEAFHPYVVDDAATDKLSCDAQMLENGLCQVSCTSNGSTSPRHPTSPKRPVSYTLSTLDSVMAVPTTNVDNLMRTHNYGSNADELESVGRQQPDTSRSPEFVGRSPAVTAKRGLAPMAVSNGEASKGLNNLNKAENYRKKSKCFVL